MAADPHDWLPVIQQSIAASRNTTLAAAACCGADPDLDLDDVKDVLDQAHAHLQVAWEMVADARLEEG